MRDVTIYKLDRKVFKEIPMECVKHSAVHKRPSILGISLKSEVDVVIKDVTDIILTADDELKIYVLNPFLAEIKIPCNAFTSVEIR